MYQSRNDYDRGVNTFSPEGRLFQVEYAIKAIKRDSTCIGIQTQHGVVLAAEKRFISTLMEPTSLEKIVEIDRHVGCAMSGLMSDARMLIDYARVEAQNYTFTYDEPISVESISQSVCDLALRFGEDRDKKNSLSRPFGVALLFGGIDETGPVLYQTDPSGFFLRYSAKSIGVGSENADKYLEKHYNPTLTVEESCVMALTILRQVMKEALTSTNVELSVIAATDKKFKLFTTREIETVIAGLPPPDDGEE